MLDLQRLRLGARLAVVHPEGPPGVLQVWNQTEQEPAAHSPLDLCFLRTAGVWLPPLYLWLLGPLYLLHIHRRGRGYLRMSPLFKVKMVACTTGSPR